jgi:DNA-binding MarR family transcriptional regulator
VPRPSDADPLAGPAAGRAADPAAGPAAGPPTGRAADPAAAPPAGRAADPTAAPPAGPAPGLAGTDRPAPGPAGAGPPAPGAPLPELAGRLGYLLKHAQLTLGGLTAAALAPSGISGRQLAVLIAIDSAAPLSQVAAASRLGVDRTTMVALIDELEAAGLLHRQRDQADRRKNVVVLTEAGQRTLAAARQASDAAERKFLSPLPAEQAAALRAALRAVAFPGVQGADPLGQGVPGVDPDQGGHSES